MQYNMILYIYIYIISYCIVIIIYNILHYATDQCGQFSEDINLLHVITFYRVISRYAKRTHPYRKLTGLCIS